MASETILTVVFALGAPLWLAVEEVLHRMPERAEPALERRPAREAVPVSRPARAA